MFDPRSLLAQYHRQGQPIKDDIANMQRMPRRWSPFRPAARTTHSVRHAARHLAPPAAHPHLRPRKWEIEAPLVLDSTPVRSSILYTSDTIKALSALATSRRNLVQLFTLCSFVLLVHLIRSLLLEVKLSKRVQSPPAASTSHVQPNSATLSASMERESSDSSRNADAGGTGTYWLKRGEWKRTSSAVGFACLVTLGCIGVKIVTAIIGHGVWSGECMALVFASGGLRQGLTKQICLRQTSSSRPSFISSVCMSVSGWQSGGSHWESWRWCATRSGRHNARGVGEILDKVDSVTAGNA